MYSLLNASIIAHPGLMGRAFAIGRLNKVGTVSRRSRQGRAMGFNGQTGQPNRVSGAANAVAWLCKQAHRVSLPLAILVACTSYQGEIDHAAPDSA